MNEPKQVTLFDRYYANIALPFVIERREMALLQWQRSGYRDFDAHDKFIQAYEEAVRLWQNLK